MYPVSASHAPSDERPHRIPYTDAFFAALGAMIARKIYAITHAPYKAIVLGCDGTLWRGNCREDGVAGIDLDAPYQALQAFMLEQQHAGMLLCLCSKNHEKDVREVFERRSDMRLQSEHITSWQVNWRPQVSQS